jgi:hypothetical protein
MVLVPDFPSSTDSSDFFTRVQKSFLDSLGPEDRAAFSACSSSDELIKSLKDLEHQSKSIQRRSLTRCQAVFQKLNEKLQPYFDALNVLASADTTSALAYGALRVIFQVSYCSRVQSRPAGSSNLDDSWPQPFQLSSRNS